MGVLLYQISHFFSGKAVKHKNCHLLNKMIKLSHKDGQTYKREHQISKSILKRKFDLKLTITITASRDYSSHCLLHRNCYMFMSQLVITERYLSYQTKLTILVKKKMTNKSLTQPCFLKVYLWLSSQEHFKNY